MMEELQRLQAQLAANGVDTKQEETADSNRE